MLTTNIQFSYLKNGLWNSFSGTSETSMDGIKIQTPANSSYYLKYRTWNSGKTNWYSRVDSNTDDYAGAPNRPIQCLQIQVYQNDGTKLTENIVVMYRARVAGRWLPWVSNAAPEWMHSVHTKYNLDGTIDTDSYYAGNDGQDMDGIEIRVYEEGFLGDFTGGEVGATSLQYMTGSLDNWQSFDNGIYSEQIDGIKIQTSTAKGYYLQYRSKNEGKTDWYPFVKSTGTAYNDYAGYPGKPIQLLEIQAYKNDGTKLRSGVIVMYRVSIAGRWLPWVSNADPDWMLDMQNKHSLGGTLSVNSTYAGNEGQTIDGVEIRIFEDDSTNAGSGGSVSDLPGSESSAELQYMTDSLSNWTSFTNTAINSHIDGIKIKTDSSKPYYLSYRSWNSGKDKYYPYVDSRGTAYNDYAGYPGKPIQLLNIYVYQNNGTKLRTGVVVMYRVRVAGRWLPWVSNADPEWMCSVQEKYDLGGTLDTKSTYAGNKGQNIDGVEIHIFEENNTNGGTITPVGKYKIIQNVPYISQVFSYPTGCESVSTVMALKYAGIDISVNSFIDNYLDKKLSGVPFDPNLHFGGDPYKTSGYGCYVPVIKTALDKILVNDTRYAKVLLGQSIESLCSDYIDKDIPVVFWATQRMAPPRKGNKWTYDMKQIQWISPMHCLLLVGYDDTHYIFNDPQEHALTYYSKDSVNQAYEGLGKQALVIKNYIRPDIPPVPSDAKKITEIIPMIRELETAYVDYCDNTEPNIVDIIDGVLGYLRAYDYGNRLWFLTTGTKVDDNFIAYVRENCQSLYINIYPYIKKERLEVSDGNIGIIDLSHMAATMAAYFGGIPADFWASWGGDLATGMANTSKRIDKRNEGKEYLGMTNQEIADATIGGKSECNYSDFCSDFDAYKIQQKIHECLEQKDNVHVLSDSFNWYYANKLYFNRFKWLSEELKCSISYHILRDSIYNAMTGADERAPLIGLLAKKAGNASEEIIKLCCQSFAKYICSLNE